MVYTFRRLALALCGSFIALSPMAAAEFSVPETTLAQVPPASDAPVWPPQSVYDAGPTFIAPGRVFEPLLADPRWPRFSAYYNYFLDDEYLEHEGTVSLGETVAIYRNSTDRGDLWEWGVQGVVYGVYDIGSGNDLYNTDWLFSTYVAWRREELSVLFRTYHDSGHIGDEFLVNHPEVVRENFVLDGAQLLASYDLNPSVRVYGGPTWFWSTGEGIYDNWLLQWGLELEAPRTIWGGTARPVAGVDVQQWEGRDFVPDVSVRLGVRFEQPSRVGTNVSILAEYYNGRERNGQFIEDIDQYFGIGLNFQL